MRDRTHESKGFSGVVKRFNFWWACLAVPGHVVPVPLAAGKAWQIYKNRKMPGHMGDVRRTVQNLLVVSVRRRELDFVKGAIPGATGGVVIVRNAVKKNAGAALWQRH